MSRDKKVPALWISPIQSWRESMVAAGRSQTTITTRTSHITQAARGLGEDPWQVTADDLHSWVGRRTWKRETRRSVYHSYRSFWAWALQAGHVIASPAAGLPHVQPDRPLARPIPEQALASGLRAADPRERLILRLAVEVGMRRAEIAVVHERDLVEDLAGWTLIVHGKGDKDRSMPLTDEIARMVRRALLASPSGWMLPGQVDGHLSPRYVGILATRVLPGAWTLHTLRHRFATRLYGRTKDLLLAQQALGHSSVATTQRYVQVPGDALREAMAAAA